MKITPTWTGEQVEIAVKYYLATAIWADSDEDDAPDTEVSQSMMTKATEVVHTFLTLAWPLLVNWGVEMSDEMFSQLGHDLWLTQQGHGAGFWDGDPPWGKELGRQLTEITKAHFKEMTLEVGDSGDYYLF